MRWGARLGVLGALTCAATALAPRGEACVEIVPTLVLPEGVAPPDAHVWIVGPSGPLLAGGSFALVPTAEPSRPLPVVARSWESSMVVELVPRGPLSPGARYEVWGFPRPRDGKAQPPLLLQTFRVEGGDDTTPPPAPKLSFAEQYHPLDSCRDWVAIHGTPASDPSGELLYAVWLAEDGRIAYDAAPTAIVRWRAPSTVEPHPPLAISPALRGAPGAWRAGVRTIDVAGNLGAPVEIPVSRAR